MHARLRKRFGARTLSTTCPSAAPAALLQGRRNLTANVKPPARGGKGKGKGKGSGKGKGKGGGERRAA